MASVDGGFNSGFGGVNRYGNLALVCRTHPRYEDGDVLEAFSRLRIRSAHATHICNPRNMPYTNNGLRPLDCLMYYYQEHTAKYKFERISLTEVRRTDLETLDEEIIGPTPNENGLHIYVRQFLHKQLSNVNHAIYGSLGSEIWFGKGVELTHVNLDSVWSAIEEHSDEREENYLDWPTTPMEDRKFLWLRTNEITTQQVLDYSSSEYDQDPKEYPDAQIVRQRKHKVNWRDVRDAKDRTSDIINPNIPVKIRHLRKHVHELIVETKV